MLIMFYNTMYADMMMTGYQTVENNSYIVNSKDFSDFYFVDFLHFRSNTHPKYRLHADSVPIYHFGYDIGGNPSQYYLIAIKKQLADSLGIDSILSKGIYNNPYIAITPENIKPRSGSIARNNIYSVNYYFKISKIVGPYIYLYQFKRTDLKDNWFTITTTYGEPDYPEIPDKVLNLIKDLQIKFSNAHLNNREKKQGLRFLLYFDYYNDLRTIEHQIAYGVDDGDYSDDDSLYNFSKQIYCFLKDNYLTNSYQKANRLKSILELNIHYDHKVIIRPAYNLFYLSSEVSVPNFVDFPLVAKVDSTQTIGKVLDYKQRFLRLYKYSDFFSRRDFSKFLRAFLFTILLELVAFWLVIKLIFKIIPLKKIKYTFICVLASMITLPIVWYIIPDLFYIFDLFGTEVIVCAELFAVIVEMLIYKFFIKLNYKQALTLSAMCNAFSYYIGTFL